MSTRNRIGEALGGGPGRNDALVCLAAVSEAPTVAEWLRSLNELYPPAWAEEWDSVGLQVGDRSWPAQRVMVALDPTAAVVGEAGARSCGLLVTHHPLLFRALNSLDLADPVARVAVSAAEARIAVAAVHTNADVADPGVSDALAEELEIEVTGVLRSTSAGARVKLVTFVPSEATPKVLDAVASAGGGVIGEYTHCSFRVRGAGSFRPSERADPLVGERGELNEAEEDRLEIVVPRERLAAAVDALVDAHPYDEAAYDAYPLVGGGQGLGRVGRPTEPLTGRALVQRCRKRLGSEARMAGDPERKIATVALCGGAGASLIPDAIRAGVDAYVTGDLKHHQVLDALAAGLTVIDAGHHGTERPFVPALASRLAESGPGTEVLVSERSTDPFEAA
jgi:dinuclear metal center YbgI/SA1388 family protein